MADASWLPGGTGRNDDAGMRTLGKEIQVRGGKHVERRGSRRFRRALGVAGDVRKRNSAISSPWRSRVGNRSSGRQ